SINAAIDRAFTGDFVIDSGSGFVGGLDPSLAAQLNTLPEVDAATGLRSVPAKVGGSVTRIAGIDRATAFEIIDVQPIEGVPAQLGPGQIAVFEDTARDKDLALGEEIPVVFRDTGPQMLRVGLIYGENQPLGDWFIGYETYDANVAAVYDWQVLVKKAPGVPEAVALAAIERVTQDYPGAEVQNQSEFKEAQAAQVNQLLALVYTLLALAIFIALLGIGNTLALSIFERIHELGLLRAVGMTRRQLKSTIRWESVIIALQGTVLGLAIGLLFGWSLVRALADEGIDRFRIPFGSLIVVVVLAALAGVLAAVLPSRRAARLNVLEAISTE
ncbi:MAG: ABC transporter permease, partial [Acidimicrobiales bacterium]